MKKISMIAVIVVILIAIGAYFLLSNLNSLVARAIEKNGSDVTQTDVSVSGVDIKLRDGCGSIKGLRVANPDGFRERYAFSLDDITVDIDIRNLREDPVVIDEIRIQAPLVNAEITETGASNVNELRKRVREYTAASTREGKESGGRAKRMRIKQFVLEKGRIEVDASALGLENRTITLPEIRLSDIGGTNGVPPDEIARVIMAAVLKETASEVAASELDRLIEEKLGGSIADKAKGLLEKIAD